MEERALRTAHSLEAQAADLERRAQALEDRERNLAHELEELKSAKRVQRRELERISGLTAAQAKQLLIAEVEQEARHQAGLSLRAIEEETKREAERRSRSILSTAMHRLAANHATESTTRLVELPSDEMKGRIIGRDGRNIRALEALTGVDLIIDETPSAVMLSSFDGVRREIARITLERLIADGRIHPALIEETFETAKTRSTAASSRRARRPRSRRMSWASTPSWSFCWGGSASAPATGRTCSTTWSSRPNLAGDDGRRAGRVRRHRAAARPCCTTSARR